MLVSAIHQHKSVTGIHLSPLSWPSLPSPIPSHPPKLSQSTSLSSLFHTANPHGLSISCVVMSVSMLLSQFIPSVHKSVLCLHCCSANRFNRPFVFSCLTEWGIEPWGLWDSSEQDPSSQRVSRHRLPQESKQFPFPGSGSQRKQFFPVH